MGKKYLYTQKVSILNINDDDKRSIIDHMKDRDVEKVLEYTSKLIQWNSLLQC